MTVVAGSSTSSPAAGHVPVITTHAGAADRKQPQPASAQPLVMVAAAMAAGIALDRYGDVPVIAWWISAAGALAAWYGLIRSSRGTALATASLLLAMAACGGLRHHLHWRLFAADEIGRFARERPQPACLELVAVTMPRRRPAPPPDPLRSVAQSANTTLLVRVQAIRVRHDWRPASGLANMIVEGALLGVQPGDRLRVVGQLRAPSSPLNPGEFDYAKYLRGDRQLAMIRAEHPDCVQTIEAATPFSLAGILGRVRNAGDRLLWSSISPERAGLASAVFLGAREQLDEDQENHFLVTGTVHILSISGLHVGILAFVLFKMFRTGLVPRGPALVAVALATLFYTLLTDAEPPAIRATVLVWAVCGALYLGRVGVATNSLALAAIAVMALNPADLFRTGTQLSFLSVLTLIGFGSWWHGRPKPDALTRLIRRTRPWPIRTLRNIGNKVAVLALAGLAIWLVTTPLVVHQFHVVSLSGLVLNIVLWLPVLMAMFAGFGILAVGWLLPPLGALLGWICDASLKVVQWSIDAAADLPFGHFYMAGPPAIMLYGYYAALALPFLFRRHVSPARGAAFAFAWVGACLVYTGVNPVSRPQQLVCGFVAVGHGSAVVLELPDGQVWLYDAGRLGSPTAGARAVEAYLRSRRISHLDAVILSHADIDHYNAVPELLQKFSVGTVYVSPQMFREQSAPLPVLRAAIERSQAPLRLLSAGDELAAGGCVAKVLHPPEEGVFGNDNAQSIVLAVEYEGRRLLLTGDLESDGLRRVLEMPPLDCDILMAPHHGSARSEPANIVNWSTPEWAVISSGQGGQATDQYRPLLGPRALNTAETGAVRARLSAERVEVRAWRVDPWDESTGNE